MPQDRRAFCGSALALLATAAPPSWSQEKPLRIVVPFPPGGSTDLLARYIAVPLQATLRRAVVVENRTGAGGAIGLREVARSRPDGSTLVVSNNASSVIVSLIQKDAGFDPVSDFMPISGLGESAMVLIASGDLPVTNVAQLVAFAQSSPEGITVGSGGVGNMGHLAAALLSQTARIRVVHVPYRGQSPLLTATVAGEVQTAFTSASDALFAFVKSGRLKLLGVGSARPMGVLPGGVPISDTLPHFNADVWQGLFAPAGTPPEVVATLNRTVTDALAQPAMRARFESAGFEATPSSPEQFRQRVISDVERWGPIVKAAGLYQKS